MLRIAICDDETAERENIEALLGDYLNERPRLGAFLTPFENGYDLLEAAGTGSGFDFYLLDVIMPDINGIEVGKKLRQMGRSGAIIYLTTSPDYAVDSYLTQAFFYLLKPVKREQLFDVLDRAVSNIQERQSRSIVVNTPSGLRSIRLNDILYVERVERYMRYYLADGETVNSRTIRGSFRDAAAELLADGHFALCGASFALGLRHVKAVERNGALLDSGLWLPVPQSAFAGLKRAWMNYWLGGGKL